jgi:hypothetical protein
MVRTQKSLIALNAALLGALALVTFAPGAAAQPRAKRLAGQYVMLDGKIQGSQEAAVYVFDSANFELIALRWDRSRRVLNTLGYRDVADDVTQAQRRER